MHGATIKIRFGYFMCDCHKNDSRLIAPLSHCFPALSPPQLKHLSYRTSFIFSVDVSRGPVLLPTIVSRSFHIAITFKSMATKIHETDHDRCLLDRASF